jgi:hypothetical protein
MAWFKVDDGFLTSSKVMSIPRSERANVLGYWLMAGVWSAHEMKDGLVPAGVLEELGCTDDARERLVSVGLWVVAEKGAILIHNWGKYQPTAEELLERREAVSKSRSEAGKRGGLRSGTVRREATKQTRSKSEAKRSPEPEPEPEPLTTPKGVVGRASRLPNDFIVTSDMAAWAKSKHPNVDLVTQTEAFRDYWVGLAGAKAVKVDWVATWRNWIRNSKPIAGQRSTAFDRNMETVRIFEQQQLEVTA